MVVWFKGVLLGNVCVDCMKEYKDRAQTSTTHQFSFWFIWLVGLEVFRLKGFFCLRLSWTKYFNFLFCFYEIQTSFLEKVWLKTFSCYYVCRENWVDLEKAVMVSVRNINRWFTTQLQLGKPGIQYISHDTLWYSIQEEGC